MGLNLATFTLIHVVISLVGIAFGLVVLGGLLTGKRHDRSTTLFLAATVATSVTGFGFPFTHLVPAHIVGAISLVVLAVAIYARYARQLAGPWGATYVISSVTALYLNVVVLVFQLFLKIPALNALAPTQSEPPFAIAQFLVLIVFAVLGTLATRRSRATLLRSRAAEH